MSRHWLCRDRVQNHIYRTSFIRHAGIIFLGTPNHGAGLARWAEMLARSIGMIKEANPKIVQVLKQDSEVLARIQDSFHTMIRARNMDGLQPINITCFYEELPLLGVGFVS